MLAEQRDENGDAWVGSDLAVISRNAGLWLRAADATSVPRTIRETQCDMSESRCTVCGLNQGGPDRC